MRKSLRSTPTVWVTLAEIQISNRNSRSINQATVELFRRRLEQGHDPPPVRLARHGDAYVVRDGRHRIAAALAAGHSAVEALLERIRGWLGRRSARRPGFPETTQDLGDEAHGDGHLACTEEERVRLPPSPLSRLEASAAKPPTPGRTPRCCLRADPTGPP